MFHGTYKDGCCSIFVIFLSTPFSDEGGIFLKVCLWCFSFVSLMLRDQLWHAAGTPSFSDHEALLFASTLSSALCDCDSNLACMLVQRLIDISGAKTD